MHPSEDTPLESGNPNGIDYLYTLLSIFLGRASVILLDKHLYTFLIISLERASVVLLDDWILICNPVRVFPLRVDLLLQPANKVCEGYVFTPVCQSFWSQGGMCGCRGCA